MEPFVRHKGVVAPLPRVNVDTDQIIPKQFLKRIERSGFGQFLFYDWRFTSEGQLNPDFELNQPQYQNASILVGGANFGCGSSREHAPWALLDYGFRAIIAPSFADIFFNNCFKNGVLPIVLPELDVQRLLQRAEQGPVHLEVDLEAEVVRDEEGWTVPFSVDAHRKNMLLHGLDDIGLTLKHISDIEAFERRRAVITV